MLRWAIIILSLNYIFFVQLVVDLDGKQYEGPTDHAKKKARQLGAKQILVEAFSFDKDDVEYLMRG